MMVSDKLSAHIRTIKIAHKVRLAINREVGETIDNENFYNWWGNTITKIVALRSI